VTAKTAVHLPDFAENPYQTLLRRALAGVGWETVASKMSWRPWSLARRRRVRVVHLHWLEPWIAHTAGWRFWMLLPLFGFQLLALRLSGVRIVWTVHNLMPHETRTPERYAAMAWLVARLAQTLFVHGRSLVDPVARAWWIAPTKIRVIPHGHYRDWYPTPGDRAATRRELSVSDEAIVFLVVGSVRRYKGVPELTQAFEQAALPQASLVVAGKALDETIEREIAAAAERREGAIVRIAEFVDDQRLSDLLHAADVLVLPYRRAMTSGALVLGMSFGLACIVPDRGCLPETLGPEGGVVFDPEKPDDLRHALIELANDPERLARCRTTNRQRAASFDWSAIAKATANAYDPTRPSGPA